MTMTAEPEVYRFLAGKPLTEKEAWSRLLMYVGHWSAFGYGFFAVLDRTTGDYLGETGLARFRRGLGTPFDTLDEAGWVFSRRVHGTGIAYEAAAAVHHWYEEQWSKPTFCLIPEENMSSFRIADRLGYQRRDGFRDLEGVALLDRQPSRI
ncbi:RimJ/RimL family protein N-acetyltransferase [Rhizobium leguminosarum]|nr:GNAT family N-acetyltransferase [Rhizobium leguminosarum]MBB5262810.1 RimJ/RimL family protein N-acetyltransferase [Rhizobium leguminosarum]